MRQKGVDEIYWRDYLPLPTWRPLTMDSSPKEYDLFLISYKLLDFKQSRTPFALVRELAPKQIIDINPETAKAKGIEDGDDVWVESHNAVTGETRKVKVTARCRELIRPDTVAMPHHYGEQAQHPWTKKEHGPTPNALFFTGEGYVTNTADQTFHVKVRVYKA
ncbi:MAG: molybdopterin dinucleotide binding domain-containing protein [Planctomycetota bacterium]|jgi:anaerobic selenocysteine-containing dehydrogenase